MQKQENVYLLADNQDITRIGIHRYISASIDDEALIIEVKNKEELISMLTKYVRSTVILDYLNFDIEDIEDVQDLVHQCPFAFWVLFSSDLNDPIVRMLGKEEKVSMVLKECSIEEIRSALVRAVKGNRFMCQQVIDLFLREKEKGKSSVLTKTEIEILKQIAQGLSVKEIALNRISSVHTIITHKKNIFRKLGLNSVHEATIYALQKGLVDLVEYYI